MKKILCVGIILITSADVVLAQPLSSLIRGVVVEKMGTQPIVGGNVMLINQADTLDYKGSITGLNGSFYITGIGSGRYELRISYIGYETLKLSNIIVDGDEADVGKLELSISPISMDEVVATTDKPALRFEAGKMVLDASNDLASEGESAAELVASLPSVTVDEDEGAQVRGQKAAVYIDGVRSNLDDVLEQIPAGSIETIEVMTNPSAKYEADAGGVINIRLKKHKRRGFNGRITGGGYSSGDYQTSANGNLRYKSFNLFMNVNKKLKTRLSDLESSREIYEPSPSLLNQKINEERLSNNRYFRTGLSYLHNNDQIMTLTYTYRSPSNDNLADISSYRMDDDKSLRHYTIRDKDASTAVDAEEFRAAFNKTLTTSGIELSASLAQISFARNRDHTDFLNTFDPLDQPTGDPKTQSTVTDELRSERSAKFDISIPLQSSNALDLGYKYQWRDNTLNNDYSILEIDEQDWIADTIRSNKFDYSEVLHGSYGMIHLNGPMYAAQFGLRIESLVNRSNPNEGINATDSYTTLLPSIVLTRTIDQLRSLQFSFSRRIVPPVYSRLNPHVINSNEYHQRHGNPLLRPERVNNYELQYVQQAKKYNISSSLFYRDIKDIIGNQVELRSDSVTYSFPDNLSHGRALGTDLNLIFRPVRSFKITANTVAFFNILSSTAPTKKDYRERFTVSGKLRIDYSWQKRYYLQIAYRYESPRITWQGLTYAKYQTNLALKTYFFGRSLTINLKVLDIFNTQLSEKDISYNPQFFTHTLTKFDSQRLVCTISYNFNYMVRK